MLQTKLNKGERLWNEDGSEALSKNVLDAYIEAETPTLERETLPKTQGLFHVSPKILIDTKEFLPEDLCQIINKMNGVVDQYHECKKHADSLQTFDLFANAYQKVISEFHTIKAQIERDHNALSKQQLSVYDCTFHELEWRIQAVKLVELLLPIRKKTLAKKIDTVRKKIGKENAVTLILEAGEILKTERAHRRKRQIPNIEKDILNTLCKYHNFIQYKKGFEQAPNVPHELVSENAKKLISILAAEMEKTLPYNIKQLPEEAKNAYELASMLAEFREMNLESKADFFYPKDYKKKYQKEPPHSPEKQNDRMLKLPTSIEQLQFAITCYPYKWWKQYENSADGSNHKIKVKYGQRGYYRNPCHSSAKQIKMDKDGYSTAFHEEGHGFEDIIPNILKMEHIIYTKQTENLPLKQLPDYDPGELSRMGGFIISDYMGKSYNRTAYELVSMGFDMAYTDPDKLHADPLFENYIYGMLALL